MRLAICTLSAVLLSGCSWLGGINNVFGGHGAQGAYGPHAQQAGHYGGAVKYGHAARGAQAQQYGQNFGGGFPQQPQFGAPQEVTGAYGTHAANAHQAYGNQRRTPKMRKPRLRGSLSLGLEKSSSGDILDYNEEIPLPFDPQFINAGNTVESIPYPIDGEAPLLVNVPANTFNFRQPAGFSGTPTDGLTIESDFVGIETSVFAPSISYDDVHSTPLRISGGLEYIATPKTTVFANVGYSTAEGEEGGAVNVIGDAIGLVTYTGYRQNVPSGQDTVPRALRNVPIAQFSYDFSDLEKFDFEVGARHYFSPLGGKSITRAITPFVAASAGAARYNEVSYKAQTELLEIHDFVLDGETIFEPVFNEDNPNILHEAQWVGLGQLNAGLEWQATPRTAIAFETGVKFETAREYANGNKGDSNVSVPFTIRGSYNF